jgi:hypothetical protein
LEPDLEQFVVDLGFTPSDNGFSKAFPAASPGLDRIYRNFEQHAEEMIMQRAGIRPVPWDQALRAFLAAVADKPINWWLTGSGALAVRGMDVVPGDLDIITDTAGASSLGEALADHLVEPVIDCSRTWFGDRWGRAFLHARVEWIGDVHADVDQQDASDFGPVAGSRLETVNWQGHEIRVPPLALQLDVSKRRGLAERVEKIQRALSSAG